MRKIYLLLFLIYSLTFRSQCIVNLGPDDFNQTTLYQALYTDIAINSLDEPHVVYTDAYFSSCNIRKYTNNKWTSVSTPIVVTSLPMQDQICIANDGTLYVAFVTGNVQNINVYKFNGTNWLNISLGIPTLNPNSDMRLAISPSGDPYIVFSDNSAGKKISVMKYNGGWSYVGSSGISDTISTKNALTFDNSGTPYVAHIDETGFNVKLVVKKFNGTSWVGVGGSLPVNFTGGNNIKIAINNLNVPYVIFESPQGILLKFNGTNWQSLGYFTPSNVGAIDIVFDGSNNPIVSFEDVTQNWKTSVKKHDGISWSYLGNSNFSSGPGHSTAITINSTKDPIVVCTDDGNMEKATVRKFNGTTWDYVGAGGFSDGPVSFGNYGSYPSAVMATHTNGDTYVAYIDKSTNYSTQVKKYNGTTWNIIGQAPINSSVTIRNQMVVDTSGVPYLLYEENGADATIVKFNGSTWVNVGGPNTINGYPCSIGINPVTNAPYVLFGDASNGQKASVKMFNGSNWISVGIPAFSNEKINLTAIAFDPTGLPYIAFKDDQGLIRVMKFDGTNWNYLNSPIGSTGVVLDINLKINFLGEIYFACRGFFDTYLFKFNGSTWQTIGNISGASSAYSGNLDMALDKTGMPIVAYANHAGGGGILISQYNGINLNLVIPSEFSASSITNPMVTTDTIGNIYVAYGADRLYAKKIIRGPSVSISSVSDTLCTGQSINLVASSTYSNYLWNTGSTNSSINVSPTVSTRYFVSAEAGGCKSYATKTITVNSCVGIKEYSLQNHLKIYPNPTINYINIEQSNLEKSKIEIINSLGQTVLKSEFKNQIDISGLVSGFYTLLLKDNSGGVITKKFVKE